MLNVYSHPIININIYLWQSHEKKRKPVIPLKSWNTGSLLLSFPGPFENGRASFIFDIFDVQPEIDDSCCGKQIIR